MLKQTSSTYVQTALTEDLRGLFEFIGGQKAFDSDEAMARAVAIAKTVLNKSSERDTLLYDNTANERDYFRSHRFALTETQKAEVARRYGSYDAFRRSMMGKLIWQQKAAGQKPCRVRV